SRAAELGGLADVTLWGRGAQLHDPATNRRLFQCAGTLEPCLLPEDRAAAGTAVVGCTVAAHVVEVNGVIHGAHPQLRHARAIGARAHAESPTAELLHLRHEREVVERPARVERREDLGFAAHLDPLAGTQRQWWWYCGRRAPCQRDERAVHPSHLTASVHTANAWMF